jgi:hypothetical protein
MQLPAENAAEVTTSPRYLVTASGNKRILKAEVESSPVSPGNYLADSEA